MWPIKTGAEIYKKYMDEIAQLKEEIKQDESEKIKLQRAIDSKEERIKQLKGVSKYYEPTSVR